MSDSANWLTTTRWPAPGDPDRVALGMERWHEAATRCDDQIRRFATTWAQDSAGRAMLGTIFGHSPFLTASLIRDLGFCQRLIAGGPGAAFDVTLDRVDGLAHMPQISQEDLQTALRVARREVAIAVAVADIAGVWDLQPIVRRLSRFANSTLRAAVAFLLRKAAASGELALADADDPARDSGLFIVAMGKLGAYELNYSSDIDLMVLYDPDRVRGPQADLQRVFVRLTHGLVKLLEERTADGFVFRTDLRLRPDPASTPPAISVLAAETYYESLGQNWERAAMIKSRVAAGDMNAGADFLTNLAPFMWRRSLDFAAIEDIQSIKRQVHGKAGGGDGDIVLTGHNIKLGQGGIREVEFFAQTQQLIWGGRLPELRTPATLDSLAGLARCGRVSEAAAADMAAAYRELRRVEHRLQMIDDQQTQTLPDDEAGLARLATFLGADDPEQWQRQLITMMNGVGGTYRSLYEEAAPLATPAGNLVFTGSEDDPETAKTLSAMGFADPANVLRTVRGWHHGRSRALRSGRARSLLTELMPRLLAALAASADPDRAVNRFDSFVSGLPAGVQLMALFHAHPPLLDLVAEIVGSVPRLAAWMGRNPAILDAVLDPAFFAALPNATAMAHEVEERLQQARDPEDVLDLTRRWANDAKFQVGVHILRQLADIDAAARAQSDIADAVIGALVPRLLSAFEEQHGCLPGRGFAVVALGKYGGRELTATSDLDLVFLYDQIADAGGSGGTDSITSDGRRPLSPSHYYQRFGQRVVTALTALTGEGHLFEVDMRLRPSGNAGPLAVRLDAFAQYQAKQAWTWEHMALTRARVVCADPGLTRDITTTLTAVLTTPREDAALAADVAHMRARMSKDRAQQGPWDVKNRRGGLVDCEFLAQYLQLKYAAAHPLVLHANTASAFSALAAEGVLDSDTAMTLAEASILWRRIQAVMRLELTDMEEEEAWPQAVKDTLVRATGCDDFAALKRHAADTASAVMAAFTELIDEPAASAPR